jgi:hypothetical protein
MRLFLAMMVRLVAILALNGVVALGAHYAPSSAYAHGAVAVVSSGHLDNDATGDCCDDGGQSGRQRCQGGTCVCPACAGLGAAIHFAREFVLGLRSAGAYSVPIPTELFHHGVIVRPTTGPPRLFG